MYKFKEVSVFFFPQDKDQLRLGIVKDSEETKHKTKDFLCVSRDYFDPCDRFQRNSVFERLLGISFDDEKEFSLEELQALEFSLNAALTHSFSNSFEVMENGTGDLKCMKKGDLLFQDSYKDFFKSLLFTESNRKYGITSLYPDFWEAPHRTIITPTEVKTTKDQLPNITEVSLTKGQSPYGVFPDRSEDFDEDDLHDVEGIYLNDFKFPNHYYYGPEDFDPRDVIECPFFTLEAYNRFLAKQKKTDLDDSKDKD